MRKQRIIEGHLLELEPTLQPTYPYENLSEEEAIAQANEWLVLSSPVEPHTKVDLGGQTLVHLGSSHVSVSSPEKLRQDKRKGKVADYMTHERLLTYADTYQRSHKLENLVVQELARQGLNAVVLPAVADGDTKSKQADIIITNANGRKFALEVKEARYAGCTLGLPKDSSSHLAGYRRYPQSLWVDSCSAWDAKAEACKRRGETLLGCIVLCPIGRLSDEKRTVYGLVYLPSALSDEWEEEETCNRERYYWAYKAYRDCFCTLGDLVEEVDNYA